MLGARVIKYERIFNSNGHYTINFVDVDTQATTTTPDLWAALMSPTVSDETRHSHHIYDMNIDECIDVYELSNKNKINMDDYVYIRAAVSHSTNDYQYIHIACISIADAESMEVAKQHTVLVNAGKMQAIGHDTVEFFKIHHKVTQSLNGSNLHDYSMEKVHLSHIHHDETTFHFDMDLLHHLYDQWSTVKNYAHPDMKLFDTPFRNMTLWLRYPHCGCDTTAVYVSVIKRETRPKFTLLHIENGHHVIQLENAIEKTTDGGDTLPERRTLYTYANDTTGSAIHTFTDTNKQWPWVHVDASSHPTTTWDIDSHITPGLITVSGDVLLINGKPVYQYSGDTSELLYGGNVANADMSLIRENGSLTVNDTTIPRLSLHPLSATSDIKVLQMTNVYSSAGGVEVDYLDATTIYVYGQDSASVEPKSQFTDTAPPERIAVELDAATFGISDIIVDKDIQQTLALSVTLSSVDSKSYIRIGGRPLYIYSSDTSDVPNTGASAGSGFWMLTSNGLFVNSQ